MRNDLRVLLSVMVLLFFILNCKFSFASVLTDTSQEMCYESTGLPYDLEAILCNGAFTSSLYGQDGQYTQAPKPSYANNLDGTVTDLNSELMWQQDPDCVSRSWQTAKDYCEDLVLANHDDWELPSRHQLVSILDFGRWQPALNKDYFNHCPSYPEEYLEYYWTDTTISGKPQEAYIVDFFHGGPLGSASAEALKTSTLKVRCVRGSSLPVSQFVDNQDGTVTDTTTGLMWQKGHQPTTTQWSDNLEYCEDLELAEHTDWRLPNIRELETLVDDTRYDPSMDPIFDHPHEHASSTTIAIDPDREILPAEFSVAFGNGSIIDSSKRNILSARCVRLGPPSDFWSKQEIDPDLGGFHDLHFINSTTGWVVGSEEKVLKTADGGNTWTILHDGGWKSHKAVSFVDLSNGWVISNIFTLNGRGYIFHTDDGGLTWNEQFPEFAEYHNDIFFLDANTGWVIGGGPIIKTEDGGVTWVEQESPATSKNDIFFLDSNTGWIVGGHIIKTEDGGTTWVEQPYDGTMNLNSVFFTDAKNGWATGINGMILHTSNGGTTWEAQDSGTYLPLYVVRFSDSRTGFIFGMFGVFLHTTNGGETWTRQYSGASNSVRSVQFVDGTGYALAEGYAHTEGAVECNLLKIRPGIIDWTDTDRDGDVDGKDLANFMDIFADDPNTDKLETFALSYGN